MQILGVGGSNHDYSACIVSGAGIDVAIEDERLSRIRHGSTHWAYQPGHIAAKTCLKWLDCKLSDLAGIYANVDLAQPPNNWLPVQTELVPHHLCHAYATYYSSPVDDSAILVVDGHGSATEKADAKWELETVSIGRGDGPEVTLELTSIGQRHLSSTSWRYFNSNSLGVFYKIVTEGLGFGDRHQGKTMGLASYGSDRFVDEIGQFISLEGSSIRFDPYNGLQDWVLGKLQKASNAFQIRADIAYAAQMTFQMIMLKLAVEAHRFHPSENISLGGGCALNGVANSYILCNGPFKNLFIHPAAGDNGLAIGAAYFGYKQLTERRPASDNPYALTAFKGPEYSKESMLEACDNYDVHYRSCEDTVEYVASRIAANEVVCVFRGRSEVGPRALGNRSILACATSRQVRDYINLDIKGRESFRPLAPVVSQESAGDYFDFDGSSPFMLQIANIKPKHRESLAGVCHVDGTARLQTVSERSNSFLYKVLMSLQKRTGVPVMINTSFNRRGEPIVETPEDALRCFVALPVKYMVLGDLVIEKYSEWLDGC